MIGENLAHFRVLDEIGRGAMGTVYRAEDEKLGRTVALKVLARHFEQAEVRRRFVREARAAAAVSHPCIASVFEIGEDGGVAFIAMELIEGKTLRARLGGGAIPARVALDIALQTSEGMAAAHAAQILHRDLKPENLIVAEDGRVKILDFGLARPLGLDGNDPTAASTRLTVEGALVGTVAYMSPEQASGRPLDHRSDLFSLGVVLYEMLSGDAPFRRSSAAETLSAILRDSPEPSVARDPRIPGEAEGILLRLLAKDPRDRYARTAELVQDLRSAVRPTTTPVARTATARRPRQLKLCVCGRSRELPFCDGSHDEEDWTCATGAEQERFGFCASRRYLNLATKLASHFQGALCQEGDTCPSVKTLVTIVDASDLDGAVGLHQGIQSSNRVVVVFGSAGPIIRDLFPESELLDLGNLPPLQAFRRVASYLEGDRSAATEPERLSLASAFISHAVQDEADLLPIADYLARFFGADLFTCADSIKPGEEWNVRILEALRGRDRFVWILSEASVASRFCSFEAGTASGLGKPIRLISLDGTRPPDFVQQIQCADLKRLGSQKPWLDRGDLLVEELIQALR